MRISSIILLTLCFVMFSVHAVELPESMFTVRVTDEDGGVITNAEVHAGFVESIKPGWGWGGGKEIQWQGRTDTNGLCVVTSTCEGEAGIAAGKDGYYWSSGYQVQFTNLVGTAVKKWQPWNPIVDVVLKKIGNPIPMYARWVRDATIPKEGASVGFDLQNGDWVAPYGKGEVVDIVFRLDRAPSRVVPGRYGDTRLFDDRLTISFPNEDDGIQSVLLPHRGGRSNLRLPATAPENGYASNLVKRVAQEHDKPTSPNIEEDANYFFRVRTKKDDKGNLVSALYGKIHGDFSGFDYGKLTFTYYLNPESNDRNVEFDPTKNLFKNLSSLEKVRAP